MKSNEQQYNQVSGEVDPLQVLSIEIIVHWINRPEELQFTH